mmetsp:Transcript_128095/g.304124  ORF Transcript_128095/g.304124 Transcript_128095/m.304124 type:complete len:178 (+) Transcript_128095:101-634(+)
MEERRRLKLWYIAALCALIVLTIVRFKTFEDPHGAMLLMLVDILGILGLCLDCDYDMQCCKNCGIMAFIGGALDLCIAVESGAKARHVEFSWTQTPAVWIFLLGHVAYSVAEIAWALLCYFVCQRIEEESWNTEEVYIASQEQVQVYGAALQWTERRERPSMSKAVEAFSGHAHKLP